MVVMRVDYVDKITDKEIQYNIMITLMKIEGHLGELVLRSVIPDLLTGGEVHELTSVNY